MRFFLYLPQQMLFIVFDDHFNKIHMRTIRMKAGDFHEKIASVSFKPF